jgi:hypothetical protein
MVKKSNIVNTLKVSCDGEETHPLVYYTLKEYKDKQIKAACHYCGKLFVYKEND